MARLIDADALMVDLNDELGFKTPMFTSEQNKWIDYGLRVAIKDLKYQPTVDAVEVVRCKDCRFFNDRGFCARVAGLTRIKLDDFCSYGERKE